MTPAQTQAAREAFYAWLRSPESVDVRVPIHERAFLVAYERQQARIDRLRADLIEIAASDPVDAALDPQRAVRIARAALKETQ